MVMQPKGAGFTRRVFPTSQVILIHTPGGQVASGQEIFTGEQPVLDYLLSATYRKGGKSTIGLHEN
jgi:hypothetical protein